MRLGLRRLLYTTFILIFLIAAPIIILYTSGYRYNFKINRLQKTGMLIIETKPKGAKIYLNNKYKRKTPAEFKNLLPDEYLVRLEKAGFYTWEKKLKVDSNLTTFANNVILFKQSLPTVKKSGLIFWAKQVPSQNKFLYLISETDTNKIVIFDLENSTEKIIYEVPITSQLTPLSWSPNNKKLIVAESFNEYLIINTETNSVAKLSQITAIKFESIHWDRTNDNILYGLKKNTLYQIDLINNETRAILSNYIDDFYVIGQNVFYITKTSQGSFLNRQILGTKEAPAVLRLPIFSSYEFKIGPSHLLIVRDSKNNELFIINADVFNLPEDEPRNIILEIKAKDIIWSKDFAKAIIYNDFEIWSYDAGNNTLVTRFSQEIKKATWLPGADYIVYTTDDALYVIELGFEAVKNNYQLVKLSNVGNDLFLDRQGTHIYFSGRLGNQEGVFELEIN